MNSNKSTKRPFIVGLGGTTAAGSTTEKTLALALSSARRSGAETKIFGADCLARLPYYTAPGTAESVEGRELVEAIRSADGIIIASPGYHGTVSGLVKNALDFLEATAKDERPYLTDLPVGLITIAGGHQAAVSTLATLRTIVHSLRGYPTPFGATLCPNGPLFVGDQCQQELAKQHIERVGAQVVQFGKLGAPVALGGLI